MTDRTDTMALLVTAVDQGSLSGASRITGLSLASVSRHLSALEERLGTRLLVRSTRKLVLTDAGRSYYLTAKRLLAEIDEMEASVSSRATEPAGRMVVTGPVLFGRVYLLPLLARFLAQHAQLALDVLLMDRPVNLMEEGVDVAIVVGEQADSSLVARRLGAIRWVLAASPAYLARRGMPSSAQELNHHDGLIYSLHANANVWAVKDKGKSITVHPLVRMRSNILDSVVAAAAEGAGIVMAPAWSVAEHVAAGRLQILLPDSELPPRPIYALMTHQRLLAGKVRMLLDHLASELAKERLDI